MNIPKSLFGDKRLSCQQALETYQQANLYDLATTANQIRMSKHPEPIVTYIVDRNINYSNICISGCKFCAFFKSPGQDGGYVLSKDDLFKKIEETISLGGVQILLQGGLNPDLSFDYYPDLLESIKNRFPGIHIHGFSPPEIVYLSEISGMQIQEVLKILIQAGLDSIPGGGAEILVDRVRQIVSPNKCSTQAWLEVMRIAHQLGLKTTATMMFGHKETLMERIKHLNAIRELQDETGGFTAFIPWTFQPNNTALKARKLTSIEYLRLLALARIFLDNIDNLQVSWVTMGAKIGQLALYFGANDFGSTMIEENVVSASGVYFKTNIEEIERNIQAAGFVPKQRRMDYQLIN